jgi:hypothetical protein
MTERPSAAARLWDAAALVLIAGGAALVLDAHAGMKGIQASQIHAVTIAATKEAPNITRWVHFRTMSNFGFALIVGGVAVGVAAWYRSRREIAARAAVVPMAPATVIPTLPNVLPNVPPE